MSIKLMSKVWEMDIPQGQKFILIALCDHANDDGVCYPSQNKLAQKCGMSERVVINHIKWLETHRLISKERRQSSQKRNSDLYQIHLESYLEPANSAPANSAPANSAPEPANFAPTEPANFSGSYIRKEPSVFNHQIKPSESGDVVCTTPQHDDDVIDVQILETEKPKSAKRKTNASDKDEVIRANPDNVATWNAYAKAYRDRYGILPVSNQKTRGQVASFVKLVGKEKAPLLAEYYLSHNNHWFVQIRHEFGGLLKSYQQIATDYAIGQQSTRQAAVQVEKTQSNFDNAAAALAARRARRGN